MWLGGRVGRAASLGLILSVAGPVLDVCAGPVEAGPVEAVPARAERAARPRLRLVWVDPMRVAPSAFEGMAEESRQLLDGMGVDAVWTRGQAGGALGDAFPVVLMPSSGNWSVGDRHVMGAAPRTRGPAPAVWVYFQEVAWALGLRALPSPSWTPDDNRSFAVALGRVVAHELVHAVLPDQPHARAGLMSERMHRSVLTGQGLEVDGTTRRAFGAAVARRLDLVAAAPGF